MTATDPARAAECKLGTYGTLSVAMSDMRPTVTAQVNGKDTTFILDTGAFFGTMSQATASALGLKAEVAPFELRGSGIGGSYDLKVARVKSFGILDGAIPNLDFTVGGSDAGVPVIGANLLMVGDLDLDLAQGKARLFKPRNCDKYAMAYWVKGGPYEVADLDPIRSPLEKQPRLKVLINGKPVRAMLDTGAPTTVLTRSAAERAGIDLAAPGVRESAAVRGFGKKAYESWIARVDAFSIGTETIRNSRMQVMDGKMGGDSDGPELLLGVDFILAHHLFFANSQRKLYFTYNGGRVFSLAAASSAPAELPPPAKPASGEAAAPAAAPALSPADLFLRGQASLARGATRAALVDFDQAIAGDGTKAPYFMARAKARLADKQIPAALTDLDKAVTLDGDQVDALLLRAMIRFQNRDLAGVEADMAAARAKAPAGSTQSMAVARFLMTTNRFAEAIPLLDGWIALHQADSHLGSALGFRCLARALSNLAPEAGLADCRKAIKRDGAKADLLESQGLAQLRLNQNAEALKSLEAAVAANPKEPRARFALGIARIRLGQNDDGLADQFAARAIDPTIDSRFARFGL